MRIITFPRTMTDISLGCERSDFEDITGSPLLSFFDDYYKTTEDAAPKITEVVIDRRNDVPLLSIHHACRSGDSATNVCPAAHFTVSEKGSDLGSTLIDLIAASPLRFLRDLTLHLVKLADVDLRTFLNCLVNLEGMQIDQTSFSSTVSALLPAREARCGGEDQGNDDVYHIGKDSNDNLSLAVPASSLRRLHIHEVNMYGRKDQLLLKCLEIRLQAGHGLARLELYPSCNLEEEDVESYRKLVSEVDWNGENDTFNYSDSEAEDSSDEFAY
jgi:hypothetical protein